MKFSPDQAIKVLCSVHGFDSLQDGMEGTRRILEKHSCIQVDPINVTGRNHDLTLFSRVDGYKPEYLRSLLYEHHELFEYYCKMLSMISMDYYPVFKNEMKRQEERFAPFFDKYSEELEYTMKVLEKRPVSSLELIDMGPNDSGTWRTKNISNRLLRSLWLAGKTTIAYRKGERKYYTPREKIIPEDILKEPAPDDSEAKKKITEIIVNSSRLVSPSKASAQWNRVGGVKVVTKVLEQLKNEGKVFPLEIEGWTGKLYAHIDDKEMWGEHPEYSPYVRFLAPLDPVLWNRELFYTIFGHEYVWEIYKKEKDRRYGYYCLPVIFNGDYVALIDPYYRKDEKVLEVRNFHLIRKDLDMDSFQEYFRIELKRLMKFLGAEELDGRGLPFILYTDTRA